VGIFFDFLLISYCNRNKNILINAVIINEAKDSSENENMLRMIHLSSM
jgi:hypothetical protein